METGTFIVAFTFILICILPFLLTRWSNNKRKKQLFKELFEYTENNKSILSKYELWSTRGIGIDFNSQMLFLIKRGKDLRVNALIQLQDYRKCSITNTTRTINQKEGNIHVTDKIELAFTPHDKMTGDIKLELYNAYTDSTPLSIESEFAEKWCRIINESIGLRVVNN